jgi:glycosyltransferase involved in cell wall biosynthesis
VLITVYNREKYLRDCIESVLSQTLQDFEVIIVDDNSSDSSFDIANSYALIDSRFRVFKNHTNIGQFPNRNKAASLARSEYLKYLDSDDIIFPSCLMSMYEKIKLKRNIGVLTYLDSCNTRYDKDIIFSSFDSYIEHYFSGNTILFQGPTATLFNKKTFDLVGGFDETLGLSADMHLMLKIAAVSNVLCIIDKLYNWRIHNDQMTEVQKDDFNLMKQRFCINSKILLSENVPFNEKQAKAVLRNIKSIFIRNAIINYLLRGRINNYFSLIKYAEISMFDFILSMFPNHKLSYFKRIDGY